MNITLIKCLHPDTGIMTLDLDNRGRAGVHGHSIVVEHKMREGVMVTSTEYRGVNVKLRHTCKVAEMHTHFLSHMHT